MGVSPAGRTRPVACAQGGGEHRRRVFHGVAQPAGQAEISPLDVARPKALPAARASSVPPAAAVEPPQQASTEVASQEPTRWLTRARGVRGGRFLPLYNTWYYGWPW